MLKEDEAARSAGKAFEAFEAPQGRQGLTQDEQVQAFKTAAAALRAAADLADQGGILAAAPHFEANQAEKAKLHPRRPKRPSSRRPGLRERRGGLSGT